MISLSHTQLWFPFAVLALSLGTAFFLNKPQPITQPQRFASLDGLRGILAVCVYIYHVGYWFYFSKGQGWHGNDSIFYMNLGKISVSLFFMVSGFLFGHKLFEARQKPIDWLHLYASRFLRLTPLYGVILLAVIGVVAVESGFQLRSNGWELFNQLLSWVLFTAPGHPDINQMGDTHLITAGVIWTLPYEWYFYFLLPCVGVLVGTRSKGLYWPWLLISLLAVWSFPKFDFAHELFWDFAGGLVAAALIRHETLCAHLKQQNLLLVFCLVMGYGVFYDDHYATRWLFLTCAFCLMAAGSNLFGLLQQRAFIALGELSYGVYLLHGVVLFIVFKWVLGSHAPLLNQQQFIISVLCATPIIVGLACLSWRFVESPALTHTHRLTAFLRRKYSHLFYVAKNPAEVFSENTTHRAGNNEHSHH